MPVPTEPVRLIVVMALQSLSKHQRLSKVHISIPVSGLYNIINHHCPWIEPFMDR